MTMTKKQFRAARQELLAGFGSPAKSRKIFGMMLGYGTESAARIIAEKERESSDRKVTDRDELIISYLKLIAAKDGHILNAIRQVPELQELDFQWDLAKLNSDN